VALKFARLIVLSLAAVASAAVLASAAPFTAGTVVVERIGDGSTGLNNASFPIAILEVTTSGSVAQTISLATSGSNQQTDSGSATSNGYLNTYFSGTVGYVSVPGLNLGTGTTSAAGTNTKVNSTLDASGSVINRTLFPTGGPSGTPASPFSGNNFRSSIATSGSTFYAAGTASGSPNTGGVWYYDGSAFTQVSSTASTVSVTNIRNVEIYNNQLYFSSSSGTFLGISALGSGLPTTGPLLPSLTINMGAGASPYAFVMFSTGSQGAGVLDLAYIADDRTTVGGGLQKWTFNGSTWSNSWALLVGASGTSTLSSTTSTGFAGLRGLTGTWDAVTGATLYATTAAETNNNRLISILDSGITPTSYTTLASAGTNYAFRGVDVSPVAPVPEPSALVLAAVGGVAAIAVGWRRRVSRSRAAGPKLS
jgi:hypothetical protein